MINARRCTNSAGVDHGQSTGWASAPRGPGRPESVVAAPHAAVQEGASGMAGGMGRKGERISLHERIHGTRSTSCSRRRGVRPCLDMSAQTSTFHIAERRADRTVGQPPKREPGRWLTHHWLSPTRSGGEPATELLVEMVAHSPLRPGSIPSGDAPTKGVPGCDAPRIASGCPAAHAVAGTTTPASALEPGGCRHESGT